MKIITTLIAALVAFALPAFSGTALEFVPPPDVPLTEPVFEHSWTGLDFGVDAGVGLANVFELNTGVRDVTKDQCWKGYPTPADLLFQLDMAEGYCGVGGPNEHYNNYAVLLEDVVVGSEEWEELVEQSEQFLVYGAHVRYLHDFGRLVVGAELSHLVYDADIPPFDGVTTVSAIAGVDLGSVLVYAHVGQSYAGDLSGLAYGLGGDVMVSNRVSVGTKWTRHELGDYGHDTIVARVSYHF